MADTCMDQTVQTRIAAFGYVPTLADAPAIAYAIQKATAYYLSATNQRHLPSGLFFAVCDMAVGLFLSEKHATGALTEVFSFEAPAKSISEGDTSVSFAISDADTPEKRFLEAIGRLIKPNKTLIAAHRRIGW